MKYVFPLLLLMILLLPSNPSSNPNPTPTPPQQSEDLLDKSTDVYRQLMSEVWSEYAGKKASFPNDEAALNWLNQRQVAAYKAAYEPLNKLSAAAAQSAEAASSFSEAFKNHTLKD